MPYLPWLVNARKKTPVPLTRSLGMDARAWHCRSTQLARKFASERQSRLLMPVSLICP
jgi:hypothetical protein